MVNLKNKDVFISGPMSGLPLNNVGAFACAHAMLKNAGARSVFDPAFEWLTGPAGELSHDYYMRKCLNTLTQNEYENRCYSRWDYILMLPGWEDSPGASLEREVALACNVDVIEMSDLTEGGK